MQFGRKTWVAATCGLLCAASWGCSSTGKESAQQSPLDILKTKTRKVQMADAESVEEVPGELKNPSELSLAYARWMEEVGNLIEARRHYSDAVEAKPKNVDAVLGLARVDHLSGKIEEAERGYQTALELQPQSPKVQFAVGKFYADQKRWNEAVAMLEKATEAAPTETTYRYQYAVALVHVGQVDKALPHFIRTVGDAEAHYNVAALLHEAGKTDEATRHLQEALSRKPDLEPAQQLLAELGGQVPGQPASPATQPGEIMTTSHQVTGGHQVPSGHQVPTRTAARPATPPSTPTPNPTPTTPVPTTPAPAAPMTPAAPVQPMPAAPAAAAPTQGSALSPEQIQQRQNQQILGNG